MSGWWDGMYSIDRMWNPMGSDRQARRKPGVGLVGDDEGLNGNADGFDCKYLSRRWQDETGMRWCLLMMSNQTRSWSQSEWILEVKGVWELWWGLNWFSTYPCWSSRMVLEVLNSWCWMEKLSGYVLWTGMIHKSPSTPLSSSMGSTLGLIKRVKTRDRVRDESWVERSKKGSREKLFEMKMLKSWLEIVNRWWVLHFKSWGSTYLNLSSISFHPSIHPELVSSESCDSPHARLNHTDRSWPKGVGISTLPSHTNTAYCTLYQSPSVSHGRLKTDSIDDWLHRETYYKSGDRLGTVSVGRSSSGLQTILGLGLNSMRSVS